MNSSFLAAGGSTERGRTPPRSTAAWAGGFGRGEAERSFGAGHDQRSRRVFLDDPLELISVDRFDVHEPPGERFERRAAHVENVIRLDLAEIERLGHEPLPVFFYGFCA